MALTVLHAAARGDFFRFSIYLTLLSYGISNFGSISLLPFIARDAGADAAAVGFLLTVLSLTQTAGSVLFGRFCDRYGARAGLIVSHACSLFSCVSLYHSHTVALIFVSRLFLLGQHALHASQILFSTRSPEHTRAAALGRLGVCYGIGFAIGPLLCGSMAASYGNRHPVLLCSFLSVVNLVCAIWAVDDFRVSPGSLCPPSPSHAIRINIPDSPCKDANPSTGSTVSVPWSWKSCFHGRLRYLILLKMLTVLAFSSFYSGFSIMIVSVLKMSASDNGLVMCYMGVLVIVCQGLLVGRISSLYLGRETLMLRRLVLVVAGTEGLLILASGTLSVAVISICMLPLVVASTLITTLVTAEVTKCVDTKDVGSVLGVDMAVAAAVRVLAPLLSGALISVLPSLAMPITGALGLLLASAAFLIPSPLDTTQGNH